MRVIGKEPESKMSQKVGFENEEKPKRTNLMRKDLRNLQKQILNSIQSRNKFQRQEEKTKKNVAG